MSSREFYSLPTWDEALFSVKTFLAGMLALYIAFSIDLSRPYWALATVYIVSQPLAGALRSKAVYRIGGTLLGAVITVALVPNLVNSPELLSTSLALWVGLCLYLSLLDRTPRSYLFILAGYSAALIGFPAVDEPGAMFDIALARVEEITLAWISTEGEFPNIRNANRFTRLKNFAVAGRPIGALMEACA